MDWVEQLWLDELWSAHSGQGFAYAARRVGRRRAEDLVAEVFAVAWRQRREHPHPSLRQLYGLARRVIGSQPESRSGGGRLTVRVGGVRPHDSHTRSRMSDGDWEVLWLSTWEGLAPREAAVVLGVTRATSQLRLWRAQRRLSAALNRTSLSDLLQRIRAEETDRAL